ncbi:MULTISPECIES: SRPBCC family protein [unclassified Amycolatopsis]|uniref:SRPBCC family protein n=1 Tax=unclassified Amycolatopsis TaxID=2618356 RepID=UPI002876BB30|nr:MULTISPECIES: SRPBCC family protein [unclassified Amycolatopsis]MDS0134120.1 SRPBCC family protein [Amycolatopsis sp. 505]MDS0144996.1 SRPBCC family protein [Amycolatopsis sp. CM201R]
MEVQLHAPNATGRIEIDAAPEAVYSLVSDPGQLAGLAEEYAGHRWVGGADGPAVGAKFRGRNQRGFRRWSTLSTITDADPGRRFGFEVTSVAGLPVARWQYDFEPARDGCVVVESMWERRPAWFKVATSTVTGVWDREQTNAANIAATLARLKRAAEASR